MLYKPTLRQIAAGGFRTHPDYEGCIGHWILNENGGPTAYDSSGYGNHGTLTNGPTWNVGQFGTALSIDGVNDYVNGGSAFNFTSESFSIFHWLKLNVLTTNPVLLWKGNDSVSGYYAQAINTNGGRLAFITSQSAAGQVSDAYNLAMVGDWHHYGYVRNGASIRIYFDGIDRTTNAGTHINPASSANNFIFGAYNNGASNWTNAFVDDVRVYNRALSAAEIARLYSHPWAPWALPRRRVWAMAAGTTDLFPAWASAPPQAPVERRLWAGIEL